MQPPRVMGNLRFGMLPTPDMTPEEYLRAKVSQHIDNWGPLDKNNLKIVELGGLSWRIRLAREEGRQTLVFEDNAKRQFRLQLNANNRFDVVAHRMPDGPWQPVPAAATLQP